MELNIANVRNMPEILAIVEYLQNMKFKRKVFGGVDSENVLDHFSQVTLQYEAIVSAYMAQCEQQAKEIVEQQFRLAETEQSNAADTAWNQYYKDLVQWYEETNAGLQAQNKQMQQQLVTLWADRDRSRWNRAA